MLLALFMLVRKTLQQNVSYENMINALAELEVSFVYKSKLPGLHRETFVLKKKQTTTTKTTNGEKKERQTDLDMEDMTPLLSAWKISSLSSNLSSNT